MFTRRFFASAMMGIACLVGMAASAHADFYTFTANIDGSQEVPSSGSLGTGLGLVTYDDTTNLLTWDITFSNLSGPATGMHFHNAPAGVNGPVVVNIGNISGLGSPSIGNATITPAQGLDLLNNNWYINIHTASFPGGEIRGQVLLNAIPEPSSAVLLASLGLGGILVRRRRR